MKCPACDSSTLKPSRIENGPAARVCAGCEGQWISSKDYWSWMEQLDVDAPAIYSDVDYQTEDSRGAKLCPDCGRILIKFKVGHGLEFRLDHCNACNGVWLDKHEWDVLKSRNLHGDIHSIFSTQWQREVRTEERARHFDLSYRQKFGEDYERIKGFKTWLDQEPLKSSILAFLTDPNPFE